MNAASYLLAVTVVGTGIFAFGPHHLGGSNAAYARSDVSASIGVPPRVAFEARVSPSSEPSAIATTLAPVAITAVDTKDFVYVPADVTVAAGSTVKFTNHDAIAHTIDSDDGSFDSKNLSEGQSWTHVFAKPGTYTYFCAYHRYMRGKIVVK